MKNEERRAIWWVRASGAAVLALAIAMFAVMPKAPVHRNVDGLGGAVIGFELARTPEDVFGIVGEPGDSRRPVAVAAMDRTNQIDFFFMVAYPALSFAIAALLVARSAAPRALLGFVGLLAIAMFVGDLTENLQLLTLSHLTAAPAMERPLAWLRVATHLKWLALFATALALGWYVLRDRGWWRWTAPVFAGAGLLGLAGVVWPVGIEAGANVIGVAWLLTWIHSLSVPTRATD